MDRQPAAVHIIRFFTQQVEKLGICHSDQEIHAVLSVRHDKEQGSFTVPQGIQFQLVISGQVADLLNIENGGPGRRADKDTLGGLTRNELSRAS